jgi:PAS domain-containing protein
VGLHRFRRLRERDGSGARSRSTRCDAAGTLAAAIERERADAGLREAEARYRAIVEHIRRRTGSASRAAATSTSARGRDDLDIRAGVGGGRRLLPSTSTPDDRERVLDRTATDETGEPFAIEYRFQLGDGSYAWIQDEARLVERADGQRFWQGFLLDASSARRRRSDSHAPWRSSARPRAGCARSTR